MGGAPDKITIKFKLNLSKKINPTLIESRDYKILADVEGEFALYVNGELFFYDEFILLIELGIELTKWVQSLKLGSEEDFFYETMDYNEGPILEFRKLSNNNWRVFSVWQKTELAETFSLSLIQKAVNDFLFKLRTELELQFKIDISVYL